MPYDRPDRTDHATIRSTYVTDTTRQDTSVVAEAQCTGVGFDATPAIRYIASRCGDRSLAEDITYDAILTILSNDDLRSDWTSLDLLFRVALNEYSNQKRKAEVRSAYLDRMTGTELSSGREGRFPNYDLAIDVRDALARIDSESRALILQYWNGYSYLEMADGQGVNESTIGMRLSRAKKRFAEELRGYGRKSAG